MNGSVDLLRKIEKDLPPIRGVKVGICPPFTILSQPHRRDLWWGAQYMFHEDHGAFTGEISVGMLKECDVDFVLVGHSERRKLFGETNETVKKKIDMLIAKHISCVLCIGETKEERDQKRTKNVLAAQLRVLDNIHKSFWKQLMVAYEPVWAIGTGVNATPRQAREAHAFIRNLLEKKGAPNKIPILYGGSVNGENAPLLLREEGIDGLLVGGASLDTDDFAKIVECAHAS